MGLLGEKSVFEGTALHDPRMDKPKKTYTGLKVLVKLTALVVLSVLAWHLIERL
jgi:hypothetical protein